MKKQDLIAAIANKAEMSADDAKLAVNALIEVAGDALKSGETIQIMGLGTFDVQDRPARKGRNPLTGEEIDIKASKAIRFKAGKALKDKVNG